MGMLADAKREVTFTLHPPKQQTGSLRSWLFPSHSGTPCMTAPVQATHWMPWKRLMDGEKQKQKINLERTKTAAKVRVLFVCFFHSGGKF